jgi:hypothetical protein
MNLNGTLSTAILRGAYNAIGTGAFTFLVMWGAVSLKAAAIAGGIAALGALGFRSGGEGVYDMRRQLAGEVKPSDVQPGSAGKA